MSDLKINSKHAETFFFFLREMPEGLAELRDDSKVELMEKVLRLALYKICSRSGGVTVHYISLGDDI